MFKPRPKQKEVLNYRAGKMGVSAVPGSGKTQTLSFLAANLIKEVIREDEEVLVVTLVNSAVENFSARVAVFIQEYGLLPHTNYIVRTLHGLSHDIVREKPALAGLSEDFQIIDEREGEDLLRGAAAAWSRKDSRIFDHYIDPSLAFREEGLKSEQWPNLVISIATAFIKRAKDLQMSPEEIREKLSLSSISLPLVEMGLSIYEDYKEKLSQKGYVDFDDLIGHAYKILSLDRYYLERMRKQWTYILEDEAQDSSRLQEKILRLLAGSDGNWVRVGDPNQAIYETFTTANPDYLRDFLKEPGVIPKDLPNSGRSTASIIDLANYLIKWTINCHPVKELRNALTSPFIEPTPPGDPQPNPADNIKGINIISESFTSGEEINFVIKSVSSWLPKHRKETVAILVPRNNIGDNIIEELKKRNIPHIELLKSTRTTRETAGALTYILRYLAEPSSSGYLSMVYKVWKRDDRENEELNRELIKASDFIKKCENTEDLISPRPDKDWLEREEIKDDEPEIYKKLKDFRALIQKWQRIAVFPVDQLILTISQDIFFDPADLAVAHKIALVLRQLKDSYPDWQLPDFAFELKRIAKNERKFSGLSEEDMGFEPEKYKGKVVVTTMHRAKGLEWDRVYLMSVNNYDFPSALASDSFISEKWFVRNKLNLQAEALAQLEVLMNDKKDYREGKATEKSRFDYACERLRLLYVGITRAKKELFITWNRGRKNEQKPALPLIALSDYIERKKYGNT